MSHAECVNEVSKKAFIACAGFAAKAHSDAPSCAEAIEKGECYPGIAMCGSGNGIQMTLNKHQGIRAALCWTVELAKLARQHNDANVLVLPARFIEPTLALDIVDAFLNTEFEGGRHVNRVNKIAVK